MQHFKQDKLYRYPCSAGDEKGVRWWGKQARYPDIFTAKAVDSDTEMTLFNLDSDDGTHKFAVGYISTAPYTTRFMY